jgi:hypothetical protein
MEWRVVGDVTVSAAQDKAVRAEFAAVREAIKHWTPIRDHRDKPEWNDAAAWLERFGLRCSDGCTKADPLDATSVMERFAYRMEIVKEVVTEQGRNEEALRAQLIRGAYWQGLGKAHTIKAHGAPINISITPTADVDPKTGVPCRGTIRRRTGEDDFYKGSTPMVIANA